MGFIGDVIYGLKTDDNYSQPMTLRNDIFTTDSRTGLNTLDSVNSVSKFIQFVLLLPLNIRQAFFRAINLQKDGTLKPGEAQVAIDVADLGTIVITTGFYLLDSKNRRYDITEVEDIRGEALLLTLKSPT